MQYNNKIIHILLATVILSAFLSCRLAGGYGTIHTPPDHMRVDGNNIIEFGVSVPTGDCRKRLLSVYMHYRINDNPFSGVAMTLNKGDNREVTYRSIINISPASINKSAANNNKLEYHLEFYLDGEKRDFPHAPEHISVPIK